MSENNTLSKIDDNLPTVKPEEKNTLLTDVAVEMNKKYQLVDKIITKLLSDTRQSEIIDEMGNVIGQSTHLHPQLLNWIRESRLFQETMWKLHGGEIEQEGQKKSIEVMAKLVLAAVSQNPDELNVRFKEWTKNRSFK